MFQSAALMAMKKWGFFSVPHLYCDTGHSFKWSSLRTRDTHTVCRAFSSWALTSCCVTTCFYDQGLSGLGFVHITFRMRGERFNRLRHSNGVYQATFIIRSSIKVRRIAQNSIQGCAFAKRADKLNNYQNARWNTLTAWDSSKFSMLKYIRCLLF